MKKQVVVLGGGFGGIAIATRLEHTLHPDEAEITMLSRENFSLFTPMLPEVSSGALDIRHVVTPIRGQLSKTRFFLAEVDAIDAGRQIITYTHILTGAQNEIPYDHAVIALGSVTSTFGLPGVAQRVFAMKTLEDAGVLRNRFVWLLERADATDDPDERRRLLTVVIVGGGFTGVETAGELVDFFHSVVKLYRNVALADIRVVLIEGGASLLPGLDEAMGRYSQRALASRGVEIMLGDGVQSADDDAIELQSGARIPTRTIVWSAGVRPSPFIAQTGLALSSRGTIRVTPEMRVDGHENLWALGDCAAVPDGKGGICPPTAQHAIRQGPILADNLLATLRRLPMRAFSYTSMGLMASLGARRAVAQIPGGRVLTGFFAWILWRSYYLMRLPGLDRKLHVAFDWALGLLFPRDIAELRVYTRRAFSSAAIDAGLVPREEAALRSAKSEIPEAPHGLS